MSDIFGAAARTVRFNRAVAEFHGRVPLILREIDADFASRNVSMPVHPRLLEIYKGTRQVAEAMMEFDAKHSQYAMSRVEIDGEWAGINPFCETHESDLVEWLLGEAKRIPKTIRRESKRLLSGAEPNWAEAAAFAADEIAYDVQRFYGEQKAFFDLAIQKATSAREANQPAESSTSESSGVSQQSESQTLALYVAEWFGVCNRLWPILYASEGLSPAQLRVRADIQVLYAELREKTKPLAVAAEQRGVPSTPLHDLTGFLETATDKKWDDARMVVKRLEAIAAAESRPTAPPEIKAGATSINKATSKQALLDLFKRRGLTPVAYLAEAAWNLREWLREVAADDTLEPVLSPFLPMIRRQVELSLLDGELSRFASELPFGEKLTAANLIAFIEGLELPGKVRIRPPPGKPPLQWMTLSQRRARRIAMQLFNEDGTPAFDYENESDIHTIEQMDRKVLVRLWNELEKFDPINDPGHLQPDSLPTVAKEKVDASKVFIIGESGLNSRQRAAFALIKGLSEPTKATSIARQLKICADTFRKHYVPALRPHGLRNDGDGYYIVSI